VGQGPALNRDAARALRALERGGLLLVTDARLPSLAALVAGEPVRGSWWGHPRGKAIFAAATQLGDHPDVAAVKLVSGKVTFVHRRLWPALLAAATARASWQTEGLPPDARRLLARVDREGRLRTEGSAAARAARVLAERLLVHAGSVHTESGAHATELESWPRWARRLRVEPARGHDAPEAIEAALRAQVAATGGKGTLPWH
jgi:hypothetical protein